MKQVCKYSCIASRVLLGLIFFVFGLNGLVPIPGMPQPQLNDHAMRFFISLADTGYLLFLIKIIETICGALILSGILLPFALVLIAPILVNIVLFHTFLDRSGMGMAYFMLLMWACLVWCYWGYFRSVFAIKSTPSY